MKGQAAWGTALLDPDRAVPAGLVTWNGSDPAQRFAVYRNNVTVSLMQALADTFPVCAASVGEARFRDLARAFVRAQPPRSPVLARYGAGLRGLRRHEPARRRLALPARPGAAGAGLPGRAPGGRCRRPWIQPPWPRPCGAGDGCRRCAWRPSEPRHPGLALCRGLPVGGPPRRREPPRSSIPTSRRRLGPAPRARRCGSCRCRPGMSASCRAAAGATLGEATATAAAGESGGEPGAAGGFDLTRCLAVLLREQILTGVTLTTPTRGDCHDH